MLKVRAMLTLHISCFTPSLNPCDYSRHAYMKYLLYCVQYYGLSDVCRGVGVWGCGGEELAEYGVLNIDLRIMMTLILLNCKTTMKIQYTL